MPPRVLLNLSNLPWVPGRLKRNQAIFRHLLAGTDLFSAGLFVNPPAVADAPGKYLSSPELHIVTKEEVRGRPVTILQPVYGLPDWYIPVFRNRWARTVAAQISGRMTDKPFWLWLNSAGTLQYSLATELVTSADRRVFDSSDDFTAWEGPGYRVRLHNLVARCDKLLCVNDHVAKTFIHPDKLVFRNCTDFATFQQRAPSFRLGPWFPKQDGAVYIGFTGGINTTRADMELLNALFLRFPAWRFLFIGYSDDPAFVSRLQAYPNVVFIPERPYAELPEIIRSFDAAIIPHADNPTTRGNDLLKVLDYMACGVPVVSTRCSNVERYREAIHITDDTRSFGDTLEALVTGTLRNDPAPGLRAAASQSWEGQVPGLLPWLTGAKSLVSAVR